MIALLQGGEYAVFALLLIALVVSLSFHEFGHALVAKWRGDDTDLAKPSQFAGNARTK